MRDWITDKLSEVFALRQITAIDKFFSVLKGFFGGGSVSSFTKFAASLVIMAECIGCVVFDTPVTPSGDALDLTGYSLVLNDDFNGSALDTGVWEYRANGARRCGFNWQGQNRLENGNLVMTAEYKTDVYGAGWYSAMIRTIAEYTYGYYEIRCKTGDGGGFWSAFWLNSRGMASAEASDGGKGGAEIDIFESSGNADESRVASTVHVGGYGDGLVSRIVGKYKINDAQNEYNTYGVLWTPDEYVFYINGVEAGRLAQGVSLSPEYPIVSLELPTDAPADTGLKVNYYIDYVRIYQLAA